MKNIISDINSYVDYQKENILSTLKRYIGFKSINVEQLEEGEKSEIVECQEWIASELESMNYFDSVDYYEVEKGRPNVVALKKGKGGGKSLLFNAHSDVVTVSKEQWENWSVLSPFDGGVKDGKVWGRGATDMKGGGTAMLFAAKAIKELGIELKGDLLLSYVDGEESGRAEIGIWSIPNRGYNADFAIMCEPTNLFNVYNKSKGEIYFDIKIKGQSTHICNRYKTIWPQKRREDQIGVNAIDKAVKLINAFAELERSWGIEYNEPSLDPGCTTLTVSMINGGESFSAQAGECTFTIASMFAPYLSVDEIKDQIVSTIEYISKTDYWLKNNMPEYSNPFPPKIPLNVPESDQGIQTIVRAFEDIFNKKPNICPSPFVGDVNYLFEKGVKGVNWGPGDLSMGIHGADEHVPVQQVLDAIKLYAATIIKWCGL